MHIGIITSEFPPDIGGVETYSAEFAKTLANMGFKVSVFVHTHHKPIDISGIDVYRVLKFCRRIDRDTLKLYNIDAWHVMNASHSWLALETNIPVLVSIHGNDFLNPYPLTGGLNLAGWGPLWRFSSFINPIDHWVAKLITPATMRKALPNARAILVNSNYTNQVFLDKFPECRGKTFVAQVGVGSNFLSCSLTDKHNRIPKLLTVSRLSEPRKNVDRVVRALALLNNDFNFEYTVIGDGLLKLQLEELAATLGLGDKVRFLGRQTTENVIAAMQESDLFILPSSILPDSHEGFGIVYLEAAACGTPSLATSQAGAIEAISDGRSGYFVDDPSIENIAHALRNFLSGEIKFDSRACKEFAEKFTWRIVVENALPFYCS